MEKEEQKRLRIEHDGKVKRVFTPEWKNSGFINTDKLPDLMQSVISQQDSMIKYIEMLHDTIDYMIEHNRMCTVVSCLTAGCTSEHK